MKLFLQQIFSTVLKWVCQIYPKDKNKILIGIPNASFYNDNSKYFFEFLWKKENKDFDFFLLTKNKKLFTKLRTKFGNHIIYAFSTQALLVYLKAKFVLLSNGNGDIFPFTPTNKKQIVINMWHAITFKNVGYLSKVNINGKINLNLNYFLVCSETERKRMMDAFRYPEETFITFGYPRNDIYFGQQKNQKTLFHNLSWELRHS
jgi:CDP-glycerol glycerophosphotransferase (TagB/SpsB family)